MTFSIYHSVRAILLDIEGTTTPADFVFKVLFPYARSQTEKFLERYGSLPDVLEDLDGLRREHLKDTRQGFSPPVLNNPHEPASFVAYVGWLIDRDRKSTPLKSLQGKIWAEGYASGDLRSQVFDDVPPALKRWQRQNRTIAIFSSGSVLAQKLLFTHTSAGDLTGFLSAYFDTTIGTKTDPASYDKIAKTLQRSPAEIVFISDIVSELDGAEAGGLRTLLCKRPGNHPQPQNAHKGIRTLNELFS
ncbi:MAG: acireductone synthase [Candidatus Sulfotelmatobacter sp.]